MGLSIQLAKKKLNTLLEDETLVEKYIRQFGTEINIKYIKQIKTAAPKQSGKARVEKGEDPVFKIKVRCPICHQPNIECAELKAKSQSVTFDPFMTPIFQGSSGFRTVDYSRVAVAVCPRCFFASPDKKDFITYSLTSRMEVRPQLNALVINRLKETIPQRKDQMRHVEEPNGYFSIPRETEASLASYQLAVLRAKIEADMDVPHSLYKAGAYCLKKALICRQDGLDDDEDLKEALKYLTQCFRESNIPSQDLENQVIYVIVALFLRLGDEKQAYDYIQVLDKLLAELREKQKTVPTVKTGSAENWLAKAKFLWEDRENPDLWKLKNAE